MTGTTTDDEQWFYTQGGQRRGPVTADELRELLATLTIDGETPVWRKGMSDWQPLRNTEIAAHLKDTPPAVAANQLFGPNARHGVTMSRDLPRLRVGSAENRPPIINWN